MQEERRATGRMVALMVAFILILSVLYQAWIRKIPVLAGVTIPALIMILYGGWVLFLAKKDKRRRINAVSNTSEVLCFNGSFNSDRSNFRKIIYVLVVQIVSSYRMLLAHLKHYKQQTVVAHQIPMFQKK